MRIKKVFIHFHFPKLLKIIIAVIGLPLTSQFNTSIYTLPFANGEAIIYYLLFCNRLHFYAYISYIYRYSTNKLKNHFI